MKMGKVVVAMAVQNDEETIEQTINGFYDYADVIYVSNDPYSGWSGKKIIPDKTLDIIRKLDVSKKCIILQKNFFICQNPLINDTKQRQYICDLIKDCEKGVKWIIQIDADEVFLNFKSVLDTLENVPTWINSLKWRLVPVFKKIDNENILVVTDENGIPVLEDYTLANRVNVKLAAVRNPFPTNRIIRKFVNPVFEGCKNDYANAPLHLTFAKSESRILQKLLTWGHANDFNSIEFFNLWKNAELNWESYKDFHPMTPSKWPRLKMFSIKELEKYLSH